MWARDRGNKELMRPCSGPQYPSSTYVLPSESYKTKYLLLQSSIRVPSKALILDNPSISKCWSVKCCSTKCWSAKCWSAKCWSAKQDTLSRVLGEYDWRASIVTLGYKATQGSTDGGGANYICDLNTWFPVLTPCRTWIKDSLYWHLVVLE